MRKNKDYFQDLFKKLGGFKRLWELYTETSISVTKHKPTGKHVVWSRYKGKDDK